MSGGAAATRTAWPRSGRFLTILPRRPLRILDGPPAKLGEDEAPMGRSQPSNWIWMNREHATAASTRDRRYATGR